MSKLNILWTNSDEITANTMVLMYANNAMKYKWWDEITVIIWGASNLTIKNSQKVQDAIKEAMKNDVKFSACKACAEELGTIPVLEDLGIEIKYWGVGLTEILNSEEKLITI